MKKLQNNYTTPEQSKRLLELGVPAWTADCYYYEEGGIGKDCTPNVVPFGEVWTDESKETMFSSYVDVPCWSVGRLMEIFDKCKTRRTDCYRDWVEYTTCDDYVQLIISAFNRWNSTLDFSKLED